MVFFLSLLSLSLLLLLFFVDVMILLLLALLLNFFVGVGHVAGALLLAGAVVAMLILLGLVLPCH